MKSRLVLGLLLALGATVQVGCDAANETAPDAELHSVAGWREEPGRTAFQRSFVSPDGKERRGLAATYPRFDPGTGQLIDPTLRVQGDELVSDQGSLRIGLSRRAGATGSRMTFEDGATIRLLGRSRLVSEVEGSASWALEERGAGAAEPVGNEVRYEGAMEGADLVQAVRPGALKTALVLHRLPAALAPNAAGRVFFEETLALPEGWSLAGLTAGSGFIRLTQPLAVLDARGAERCFIQAPEIYEEGSAKSDPGHRAPVFAEARFEAGVLTYRAGVPAAWLAEPTRRFPVVFDPTLTQDVPLAVSTSPTSISITPVQNFWNAVAVASAQDWDMTMGSVTSAAIGSDILVANGNKGLISETSGSVSQFMSSGASSATVEHADLSSIDVGQATTFTWGATHAVHLWEVYVSSMGGTGTRSLTVSGVSGLRWALYRPGTTPGWRSRLSADHGYAVDSTARIINFDVSGYWALVVFTDGAVGPSGTLSISWGTASSTADVTGSVQLQGSSFPLWLEPGQSFDVQRTLAVSGTLPAGTNIGYSIRLSDNTIISGLDDAAYTATDGVPGTQVVHATVPAALPAGRYYVGLLINPIPGEANTSNNYAHDAASGHQVAIIPALTSGGEANVSDSLEYVRLVPEAGHWNVVAACGSSDWTILAASAQSSDPSKYCELLAADGRAGTPAGLKATLSRPVDSLGTATVAFAGRSALAVNTPEAWRWGDFDNIHVWEVSIPAAGPRALTVRGAVSGLRALVIPPAATADWQVPERNELELRDSPQAHEFRAGTYALAVFRGVDSISDGNIEVAVHEYNVSGAVSLEADELPVQAARGKELQLRRTIQVAGVAPPGTAFHYSIRLTRGDTPLDTDPEVASGTATGAGDEVLTVTLPGTLENGTYRLAMVIDPSPGELDPNDNRVVDSSEGHELKLQSGSGCSSTGGGGSLPGALALLGWALLWYRRSRVSPG